MTNLQLRRGEIWWVDFEPAKGGEIRKIRPAVIVSNDVACRVQNRVQVLPVTSRAEHVYPWEAAVKVEGRSCKAMADQLRTVAKERLIKASGRVTDTELQAIARAIRVQLDL